MLQHPAGGSDLHWNTPAPNKGAGGNVSQKGLVLNISHFFNDAIIIIIIIIIVIIIIIKIGRRCKAQSKLFTPYQSEDPSPIIPLYRKKEEKGKTVEDKKTSSSLGQ